MIREFFSRTPQYAAMMANLQDNGFGFLIFAPLETDDYAVKFIFEDLH